MYAKLINKNKIEKAPLNKGSISNYNLSVELMTDDGYKPVVVHLMQTKRFVRLFSTLKDTVTETGMLLFQGFRGDINGKLYV